MGAAAGSTHLDTVSTVDLALANVILPDDSELDDPLGNLQDWGREM